MKTRYILCFLVFQMQSIIAFSQATFYDVRLLGESELPNIDYADVYTLSKTGGNWCQNYVYHFKIPRTPGSGGAILHNTQLRYSDDVGTSNNLVTITNNSTSIMPDSYGNEYYTFDVTVNPNYQSNSFDLVVTYDMTMRANLQLFAPTDPYPLQNVPPAISSTYLAATTLVDHNNAAIKSRADAIKQGLTTELEVVQACAEWIHAFISDQTGNPSNVASVVLSNGYGDCDGQAHLMVAFLRYLGIPAKITDCSSIDKALSYPIWNGTANFSGGNGVGPTGPHTFYEVYYPTKFAWIAGDPAQKSLHFHHPTNVEICKGLDSDIIENLFSASMTTGQLVGNETPPSGLLFGHTGANVSSLGTLDANQTYEYYTIFYGPIWNVTKPLIFNSSDQDILVGPFDYVTIKNPPSGFPLFSENTKVISLGKQANYYAEFHSYDGETWATTWDFKIELYHTGGTYTYMESTGKPDFGDYSFWQPIAQVSLPCYNWARYNGNINGKIIAKAHTNDGWAPTDEMVIEVKDIYYIQNKNFTSTESIATSNFCIGSNVDPSQTAGPVKIKNGANVTFDHCNELLIEGDFEVEVGGIFETM